MGGSNLKPKKMTKTEELSWPEKLFTLSDNGNTVYADFSH